MKTSISIIIVVATLLIFACKKESTSPATTPSSTTPPPATVDWLVGKWYQPSTETLTFNSDGTMNILQDYGSHISANGTYVRKGADSLIMIVGAPLNYQSRAKITQITSIRFKAIYLGSSAPNYYDLVP